ncbi:hypothetical protein DFR70_102371 [Nocardia tenerifensis]|uniref:Uncharacterized protein n=1 Tax=Nocardia tenerifensis TaxID=228006 RepID=A0A318KJX9_9NOCA|nr:hypothetical protein [Nocardia tenerifensis]PXX68687.1 hypothetical protein DFR70_102371 [Nocardia tenerifensis]
MTVDGPYEIPPLDDAPDIARTAEPQPGETLADTRNWAGFGLLFIGVLVAVAAAVVAMWGSDALALVLAVFALVTLLAGAALVVFERLRRRARTSPSPQEAPAWQSIVRPGE